MSTLIVCIFAKVGHRSGKGQVRLGQNFNFCPCWLRSPADRYLTGFTHSGRIYRFKSQCVVPKMSWKVQGQGHVRLLNVIISYNIRYWIGYVRHMFYGLFCSQNATWTLKKLFEPQFEQILVKVRSRSAGQVRSNLEIDCEDSNKCLYDFAFHDEFNGAFAVPVQGLELPRKAFLKKNWRVMTSLKFEQLLHF